MVVRSWSFVAESVIAILYSRLCRRVCQQAPTPLDQSRIDEVFERAKREVTILESCDCENLPKIGPIPLTRFECAGQSLIVFSEEFIAGESLEHILKDEGLLNDTEAIKLGDDLCRAVDTLWKRKTIHRDIKPANIMRRRDNGQFVLLDPGIAFDLNDNSLTARMAIAHTPGYLAPELSNPTKKRDADCRSDFFLIGTVLYLSCTGRHPFLRSLPKSGQISFTILLMWSHSHLAKCDPKCPID